MINEYQSMKFGFLLGDVVNEASNEAWRLVKKDLDEKVISPTRQKEKFKNFLRKKIKAIIFNAIEKEPLVEIHV